MTSDLAPVTPGTSILHRHEGRDLQAQYEHLRETLEALQAEPVKDFPAIDMLIDQLEQLQLAIKGEHGIKGNNPNE